ncbi:Uncharacterized protein GY17_00002031 [Cryptosporidium hominis]|uniref:Uncharacterized protein n=1 Tax=Cryptosporidium hominis TaxID=237895 RepID=A0ABX5BEZ4_CRYHO|nr:hypothetical protein [Cryptosporidium hominis TU502]PPS94906.1 Uncharacterized protein GY17_00002031 [Cryptosporidium hominis]|eukprot:PPS94906.1 Uncharacterized protein GY17_00002031 [Cryptosporidium hominis]
MMAVENINDKKEHSLINNTKKYKRKIDKSKLNNIDIVFLDDFDKIGCRENIEAREEKKLKENLSVSQRIQVSFLVILAITNLLVYTIAFCTGKKLTKSK